MLKLLSGAGFAFLLSYAAKIILLKLYSPADFGVFAFVAAVVAILGPLASLRYEDALLLPDDDRRAAHVLLLSLGSLLGMCLVFSGIVIFREEVARAFGDSSVSGWVWTIPALLLFNRGAKIVELWLARKDRFGLISAGQVAQSSVMTAIRIGAGLVRANPAGLIFGFALGYAASLSLFLRQLTLSLKEALKEGVDWRLMRSVARRYRKFPMFTMPAAMLGAGVTHAPSILLLFFFDSSVLGVYSQAFAVLLIPLSQVGGAVAQVFFVRAVEARRAGTLGSLSATVHRRLVSLALFPAGVAMIAAPDLFQFVFGETWRASGEYLLYLSPWIMLTVVSSPLTRLFDVLERQKLELLAAAAMLAVVSASLVAGGLSGNVERTLLFVGIGGAAVRLAQIVLLMRLSGVRYAQIVRPYAEYALLSVIPLVVLTAAKLLDSLPLMLGTVVLVSTAYVGLILKRDGLLADRSK